MIRALGIEHFALAGTIAAPASRRGTALDHPGAVTHLAVLDSVPTNRMHDTIDQQQATTVAVLLPDLAARSTRTADRR